ncbi:hypothetical protein HK101_008873 [Irineochytrium annulatum]|nr:hypothetical protein HK101_008873 [Irineochytrium annulatum]
MSGWFDTANLQNINLSSIASKVSSQVSTLVREGSFIDDEGYRKKNDLRPNHNGSASNGSGGFGSPRGVYDQGGQRHYTDQHGDVDDGEMEDLNSFDSFTSHSPPRQHTQQDLERINRELRLEVRRFTRPRREALIPSFLLQLQRVQTDLTEHLATRDNHIKALEARLMTMRNASQPSSPPPQPASDAEQRANLLQEKLNKAVSHLKPLVEENRTLSAKLAEKETVEEELKAKLEKLQMNNAEAAARLPVKTHDDVSEKKDADTASLRAHVAKLEASMEEAAAREEGMKEELQALSERLRAEAKVSTAAADDRTRAEELSAENERLKRMLSEKEHAVTDLDGIVSAKDDEIMRLRDEKERLTSTNKSRSDDVNSALGGLKKENVELKEHVSTLETALHERDEELALTKSELETISEAMQQSSQVALERENLQRELRKSEEAALTNRERLQGEIKEFAERVNVLKSEVEEREMELRKKEEAVRLLHEKESDSRAKLELGSARERELQSRISAQDAELKSLHERLSNNVGSANSSSAVTSDVSSVIQSILRAEADDVAFFESWRDRLPDDLLMSLVSLSQLVHGLRLDLTAKEKASADVHDSARTTTKAYDDMIVELNAEVEERTRLYNEMERSYAALREERDRVVSEQAVLMERLTTVKSSVMPKLQAEMEESGRLRVEVDSLNATVATLREERSFLKAQMDAIALEDANLRDQRQQTSAESAQMQSQFEAFTQEIEALRSELEKSQRRLAALQHHMAESEENATQEALRSEATLTEYKLRLSGLERERETWEDMIKESQEAVRVAEERAIEARESADMAREELELALRGRERDSVSLANLQSVLEEFQASKDAELEFALEGVRKQMQAANKSLEEYRERALKAEERLESIDLHAPSVSDLEIELQERNVEIGRLRARVISLESYLAEAVRRAGSAENQVDRRLISNLLVQFLATSRGDTKRFEMLSVIANVLRLSDEDKVKVGLLRKVGASAAGATSPGSTVTSESFTDLWISFLIRESSNASLQAEEPEPSATPTEANPHAEAGATPTAQPTLVLDLNGTLMHRISKAADKNSSNANPFCPKHPDGTVNGKKIYQRPFLDYFINRLFDQFHVGAWTSATPKNALPLATFLMKDRAQDLLFVWDRTRCDFVKGNKTVKDLRKIWQDPWINRDNIWGPMNTILLDDSIYKSSSTPANLLLLPTFTVSDSEYDCKDDTALLSVLSYLEDIARRPDIPANPHALPSFLKQTPLYQISSSPRSDVHLVDNDGGEVDVDAVSDGGGTAAVSLVVNATYGAPQLPFPPQAPVPEEPEAGEKLSKKKRKKMRKQAQHLAQHRAGNQSDGAQVIQTDGVDENLNAAEERAGGAEENGVFIDDKKRDTSV